MKVTQWIFIILLAAGGWAFYSPPPVQAACEVQTATLTYANGTFIGGDLCDANGNKKIALGGTANGGLGLSTAAAPSLVEGAGASFSFDLSGNARFTMGTLQSGEDQPNNLMMTSGGAVRQLALGTSVSTNTTGSVVLLPVGVKNIQGRLVCNAGGSTNCGITIEVLGSYINSTTGGVSLCTVVIPTGTATLSGSCPPMQVAYSYWWYVTTGVAGTSPVLNIYAQY